MTYPIGEDVKLDRKLISGVPGSLSKIAQRAKDAHGNALMVAQKAGVFAGDDGKSFFLGRRLKLDGGPASMPGRQ
jgi:hypothetical protein